MNNIQTINSDEEANDAIEEGNIDDEKNHVETDGGCSLNNRHQESQDTCNNLSSMKAQKQFNNNTAYGGKETNRNKRTLVRRASSDKMISGDVDGQDEEQNGTRAQQTQEPQTNTTRPGAFATPGRASGLPVVHQVVGPALPQAVMVDGIEAVNENQQTIHASVITDAEPVRPMYQQKRCWIGGVIIAGLIITIVIMANGSTGETGSEDTSVNDIEQQVLIYFYNATGGSDWIESTEWVTDSNICRWYGVKCGTVGEITFVEELRFPDNNLAGDLEAISLSLSGLQHLRVLYLDSNLLTGNMTVISTNLAQLSGLIKVDMRLNNLTGTVSLDLCESELISELRVDCDIDCECCEHEDLCERCYDLPGWHDSGGYDCAWYYQYDVSHCEEYGSFYENEGHTANTACCVCSGGFPSYYNPSSSPSQFPTSSYKPTPSQSPSSSPLSSQLPTTTSPPTSGHYLQHEKKALIALFESTKGEEWSARTNWLSSASTCDWHGIDCSEEGAIIGISLNSNGLEGLLPTEIGMLNNLVELRLSFNVLSGPLPSEIGLLSHLWILDLSNNSLTGILPSEIGLLSHLDRMDLCTNGLTGSLPSEIGLLINLTMLILPYNHMTGPLPSEMGLLLRRLDSINLSTNDLTGSLPSEVGLLNNLRLLALNNNHMTGILPSEIGLTSSLQNLWLDSNSFTGIMPNGVCVLVDSNVLLALYADCDEIDCPCCTHCCVDGGNCVSL